MLDLLFEKTVKPKLRGYLLYCRYADDFLILFENLDEVKRVLEATKAHMEKFSLELAEEKTKILLFGRFKGTKENFDFPGFTLLSSGSYLSVFIVAVFILSGRRITVTPPKKLSLWAIPLTQLCIFSSAKASV